VLDPRVERGMDALLALRGERLAAGDEPLGWKLGFGTPAAMETLGIDAPLVGFLLRSAEVESDGAISLAGMTNPRLEPEVAVHMGADLPAGADDATAAAAIGAIGPAFELADIHPPPEDVERVLAADIFQRHVVLGPAVQGATLRDASARIVQGDDVHDVDDPEAPSGPLTAVVRHVADLLDGCGERLRAGEVVIAGALIPPLAVKPGDRVEYELRPLGAVTSRFED
jgi:2-keto-4-pentenoate hydratase